MVFVQETKPRRLPDIETEVIYHVPEHQILLSFNGDDDAVQFEDWWHTEGVQAFSAYLANNHG